MRTRSSVITTCLALFVVVGVSHGGGAREHYEKNIADEQHRKLLDFIGPTNLKRNQTTAVTKAMVERLQNRGWGTDQGGRVLEYIATHSAVSSSDLYRGLLGKMNPSNISRNHKLSDESVRTIFVEAHQKLKSDSRPEYEQQLHGVIDALTGVNGSDEATEVGDRYSKQSKEAFTNSLRAHRPDDIARFLRTAIKFASHGPANLSFGPKDASDDPGPESDFIMMPEHSIGDEIQEGMRTPSSNAIAASLINCSDKLLSPGTVHGALSGDSRSHAVLNAKLSERLRPEIKKRKRGEKDDDEETREDEEDEENTSDEEAGDVVGKRAGDERMVAMAGIERDGVTESSWANGVGYMGYCQILCMTPPLRWLLSQLTCIDRARAC